MRTHVILMMVKVVKEVWGANYIMKYYPRNKLSFSLEPIYEKKSKDSIYESNFFFIMKALQVIIVCSLSKEYEHGWKLCCMLHRIE